MPFGGLLGAGISAAGSLIGGLFGSSAADKAAKQQAQSAQQALDFQKQVYSDQKANQQPFLDEGKVSLGKLMQGISDGTFGSNSLPTAEQARATPGYQFNLAEGQTAIDRGQAAAGGAFTGGTLKALGRFTSGLADSTYQQTVNDVLANNQQNFAQLYAPAQLGEGAVSSINNTGSQVALNAGNLMTQQGNALSAGTIGQNNAFQGALSGITNAITGGIKNYKPGAVPAVTSPFAPGGAFSPGAASAYTSPNGVNADLFKQPLVG